MWRKGLISKNEMELFTYNYMTVKVRFSVVFILIAHFDINWLNFFT